MSNDNSIISFFEGRWRKIANSMRIGWVAVRVGDKWLPLVGTAAAQLDYLLDSHAAMGKLLADCETFFSNSKHMKMEARELERSRLSRELRQLREQEVAVCRTITKF